MSNPISGIFNGNSSLDKASLENERNALWIRMGGGADVTCVQVAGLIARRILCYVRGGDRLARPPQHRALPGDVGELLHELTADLA